MPKHELATEGAWVVLPEEQELRNKDRKRVLRTMFNETNLADGGGIVRPSAGVAYAGSLNAADLVAALLIADWSVPYLDDKLPVYANTEASLAAVLEQIDELKTADADALTALVADTTAGVLPSKDRPSVGDSGVPNSPTGASAG
jgi:hypothetical protein